MKANSNGSGGAGHAHSKDSCGDSCGDWCLQYRLLLWKNYLLRKRTCVGFLFELLLPVVVIAILVGIRSLIDADNIPTRHYVLPDASVLSRPTVGDGLPVTIPASLHQSYQPAMVGGTSFDADDMDTFPRVGVAPVSNPVVREYAESLNASFVIDHVCSLCSTHQSCPSVTPNPCGAGGWNCPGLYAQYRAHVMVNTRRGGACAYVNLNDANACSDCSKSTAGCGASALNCATATVHPGAMQVLLFDSATAMDDYTGSSGYDTSLPVLSGGVVFSATGADGSAQWSYSLRGNNSFLPPVGSDSDDFQLVDPDNQFAKYAYNGLLWLQHFTDAWILNRERNASGIAVDSDQYFDHTTYGWMMPVPAHREDSFATSLINIVPLFYLLAFIYPGARVVRAIVEEKETRIKEGMRMMGLADSAFWVSWFTTFVLQFLVTSILIVLVAASSLYPESNAPLIAFWFFSFCVALIAYGTAISTLFSNAKLAGTMSYIFIFGGYVPLFVMTGDGYSQTEKRAASLLPPTAFGLGATAIAKFEGFELGITGDTLTRTTDNYAFADSLFMLWVDAVVFAVITWYLDAVFPTDFGTRKPLYFCVTKEYCKSTCGGCCCEACGCGPTPDEEAKDAENALKEQDPTHFEPVGAGVKAFGAGVELRGVRKVYDDGFVAVQGVSVDMYKGQIFCLLGHNGAGKTSLMSTLTGMVPITSGDAVIAGASVTHSMALVRQRIGVCPQHDVLYPTLTVYEHLRLFATLKGVPQDRIDGEIKTLVETIGLTEKMHYPAGGMSGGQKRKLSVAIAFIGGSEVVFLDEPSSGMDPYSRRALWEMLVKMKAGRVIVLTTHFMDEADILGDRIAIMTHGQIQCCGTSLFLKELYGVGYSLTITREKAFVEEQRRKKEARKHHVVAVDAKDDLKLSAGNDTDPLVELIRERLGSGAEQTSSVGAELGYRVPLAASRAFPALFHEMDTNKAHYQIREYGVSVTTLEEVFLKVGGADSKTRTGALFRRQSSGDLNSGSNEVAMRAQAELNRSKCDVCRTHLFALYAKRFHYAKRDVKAVVFQLFIPILFLILGFSILKISIPTTFDNKLLGPHLYNQPLYTPYNAHDLNTPSPNDLLHRAPAMAAALTDKVHVEPFQSTDPLAFSQELEARIGDHEQSRYIALYTPSDSQLRTSCQYSDSNTHFTGCSYINGNGTGASALSLPCGRGAFYAGAGLVDPTLQLTACNAPGQSWPSYCASDCPNNTYSYWNGGKLVFGYFFNNTAYHVLPTAVNLIHTALLRNTTGKASAQISVSVHPFDLTYRQSLLVSSADGFSAAVVTVIAFIFIPASYAVFVVREREIKAKHLQSISGVTPVAYWLGAYLWDMTNYIVPFVFAIIVVVAFDNASFVGDNLGPTVLVFALYGPAVAPFTYMFSFAFKSHSTAQTILLLVYFMTGLLLMIVSFALEIIDSTRSVAGDLKFFFRLFPTFCLGDTMIQLAARPFFSLISGKNLTPWSLETSGYNLIYLGLEVVVYSAITVLLEYLTNTPELNCCDKCLPLAAYPEAERKADEAAEDIDVAQERQRMIASDEALARGEQPTDAVRISGLRKVYPGGKLAVRNLYYGVGQGECFGFLGINGAGKTTTLSMLSGEFPPTSGTATLMNQDIVHAQERCRRLLGYCPQFDALLDLMTAREHLFMFARFKGVKEEAIAPMVDAMIDRLSLKDYADRPSGTYSGGNKRKLSVAIALIGDPPVVFLDEPSTGMDPVSRRFMWDFISSTMRGRSVILTTHSMEECEALCHRVGIMVGGRLRCIGTAQHIKSRYAQGFQLDLHTGDGPVVDQAVRAWMGATFPTAQLAEHHPTRYKYQLPADLTLTFIFGAIEANKERLTIKEYSVGQTTLEQVFIEFAKQQSEEKGAIAGLQNIHSAAAVHPAPMPLSRAAYDGPAGMHSVTQTPAAVTVHVHTPGGAMAGGATNGSAGGNMELQPLSVLQTRPAAASNGGIQPVPVPHPDVLGYAPPLPPVVPENNAGLAPGVPIPSTPPYRGDNA